MLTLQDDLKSLLSLARQLITHGETVKGQDMLIELDKLYPNNHAIKANLAYSYLKDGDFNKADALLNPVLSLEGVGFENSAAADGSFDEILAMAVLSKTLQQDYQGADDLASRIQDLNSSSALLVAKLVNHELKSAHNRVA